MTWVLIMFAYASDSMALGSVPGFASEAACVAAGQKAVGLANFTIKSLQFVCVVQPEKR